MAVSELLDENEAAPENIGAMLRDAREAAGFSIADVAERMRLSRHHIENLEADRFDLFPVSVFLRGYLTSYARLVGIDSEPLLEAYDRRGFGPPQLHSQDTTPTTARGSEFTVTITTLVVIAVLIALSALWWREQWTEDGGMSSPAVEQPDEAGVPHGIGEGPGEPAESPAPGGEAGPVELPGREDAADAPEGEPPPVPARAEPAEPAPAPVTDSGAPAEDTPPEAEDAGAPAESVPPEAEGAGAPAEDASDQVPGSAPAPPETVEPGPSGEAERPPAGAAGEPASLVIRVHEDCWLMIRDAEQRLIYRNLASAGTVLELSAVPPVRIVAGYASGIEIEYNGVPFDLSPHVEQDTGTARFRLGS